MLLMLSNHKVQITYPYLNTPKNIYIIKRLNDKEQVSELEVILKWMDCQGTKTIVLKQC
jgi:hypothetical protein